MIVEHTLMAAAESNDLAGALGSLAADILFPGVGLLLVIQGLRRRGTSRWATGEIVAGSVVLVLSLVGLAAAHTKDKSTPDSHGLSVGQCISDEDYVKRNPVPLDCQRDDAVYELAFTGDGSATCPDGERENSDYAILSNSGHTYCFTINLREGGCYHIEHNEAAKNLTTPVACTSNDASMKIDRRIDGSTDVTKCATGTKSIAFPDPPRLYCVGAPTTQNGHW